MDKSDNLNLTIDEYRFLRKHQKLAKKLKQQVHFSTIEIECLMLLYKKLVGKKGTMSAEELRLVLYGTMGMTDEFMLNKILMVLVKKSSDKNHISLGMWVNLFDLFLGENLEKKIDYCYEVYNVNGRPFLGQDILFGFLGHSILCPAGRTDEESVRDFIDILSKKMDMDRDGKISYDDYKKAVLKQPCLLEFLGQCLPDKRVVQKLRTIFNVPDNYE